MADVGHGVSGDFVCVCCCCCFGMGGMEVCLNGDKKKPIERDRERNHSTVNFLERQGAGAEGDRRPQETNGGLFPF